MICNARFYGSREKAALKGSVGFIQSLAIEDSDSSSLQWSAGSRVLLGRGLLRRLPDDQPQARPAEK